MSLLFFNRMLRWFGKNSKPQAATLTHQNIEHTVAACVPIPRVDEAGRRRQLSAAQKSPSPAADILFIGDSLLANWEAGPSVHNIAIRGDRIQNTLWMLCNLGDQVHRQRFRKVVLLVGTNNISRKMGPTAIFVGLRIVTEMINDIWPDAEIVVMTIPFRSDRKANDKVRRRVNRWIKARRFGASSIIDTDMILAGEPVVLEEDGLHLSKSAYSRLSAVVMPVNDNIEAKPEVGQASILG